MIVQNKTAADGEELSKMSRFFRLLPKIGLLPLSLDLTTKKLTFRIRSRPTAYFFLYFSFTFAFIFFCFGYKWGFENAKKFWINMYEANVTDFLTYTFIVGSIMIAGLQFKQFNDITKISDELILAKNLKWPKHGTLLSIMSIFCTLSQIFWGTTTINARITISFSILMWLTAGFAISMLFSHFVLFYLILFQLTWLEHFPVFCTENFRSHNILQHTQKCLDVYNSIQNGFGFTILHWFVLCQIFNVITLYNFISILSFAPFDTPTNIILSLCYAVMFLFCGTNMHIIIVAAEGTHTSLQNLTRTLKIMLMKEKDEDTKINAQLLIDEIKATPPLNGNGYFELKTVVE